MDICVRICRKEEEIYDENGIRFDRHSIESNIEGKRTNSSEIFYFESGKFDDIESSDGVFDSDGKRSEKFKQSLLVTDTHGAYDFEINTENLFLWNDSTIKFCDLKHGIHDQS